MKKRLQKLVRLWFAIPKYEKRIHELESRLIKLSDQVEYLQEKVYRYKRINKELRLKLSKREGAK
jgi:predicted RNase H-like nuclease (RuvC/YqgF family)